MPTSTVKKGRLSVKTPQPYTALLRDEDTIECVYIEATSITEAKQFLKGAVEAGKIKASVYMGVIEGNYETDTTTNTIVLSSKKYTSQERDKYYEHLKSTYI